jgi:hypothetical protein
MNIRSLKFYPDRNTEAKPRRDVSIDMPDDQVVRFYAWMSEKKVEYWLNTEIGALLFVNSTEASQNEILKYLRDVYYYSV